LSRLRPIHTLLPFLIPFLLAAAPQSPPAPPQYQIVLPSGQAHELLPKTCQVCHKQGEFRFFIVASPTQEDLERVAQLLTKGGGPALPAAQAPTNPHVAVACPFCHLEEVAEGKPTDAALSFRTMDGTAASRSEVEKLCELCHPKGGKGHTRVIRGEAAKGEMAEAGLPLSEGRILCTTCHEMHGNQAGPADVRGAFLSFAAKSTATYPHGNRAACRVCHVRDKFSAREVAFTEADPTARCTRCHDAEHGGIHPPVAKPSERTYPMDFLAYPLDKEGRLTCSTCHDHVCAGRPDPRNPRFLRGGPYLSTKEFCDRCHPKAGAGSINPHDQVDEKGGIVTATCAFCHRTIPDAQNAQEIFGGPKDLLVVRSSVELCARCHELRPHPERNHIVELSDAKAMSLAMYEKRHKVKLPLEEERRITCTTCHNPHDKGVLRGEAALGAGEPHRWRVPSFGELCTPCHGRRG